MPLENLVQHSSFKKRFIIACDIIADKSVFLKAIKIALVVGTLLNLINQGEYLLSFALQQLAWGKFFLTYTIPFFVSSYTAISLGFEFKIGDVAPVTSNVACKNCKKTISHITKGELIPECTQCGLKTKWKLYN